MGGLRNRFDETELNSAWAFHYTCMWCGKNNADCFHHIMSPSSQRFKYGEFNNSILNSCPLNNFECHIGNGELHNPENEKKLLWKTLIALLASGYKLKNIDYEFLRNYKKIYEN